MNYHSLRRLGALGLASLLLASAPHAQASSFSLFGDQSVAGSGVAGAGGAAVAYDASTIFYNPAGMSFLQDKLVITLGASYIIPNIGYQDTGSLTAPGSPIQQPTRGAGTTKSYNAPFLNSTVPQLYVAYKINDKLSVGLGVNAPFGLETDWNQYSKVRYNATDSRITNVNFNPSISYKILPNLSIGAGFNISYTQVALHNAIDFGLINAQLTQGIVNGILTNPGIPAGLRPAVANAAANATAVTVGGITPQRRDGYVRLGGEDTTYGWNVGLLYEPIKGTKLGLSFRSQLNQTITGNATYDRVPNYAGVGPAVTTAVTPIIGPAGAAAVGAAAGAGANGLGARFINNRPISADLTLPMYASGSFVQDLTPSWALLGDVTWTRWSSIQQVAITYEDMPSLSPTPLDFSYKNTFRYSLGTTYKLGAAILRLGFAYDNTPVNSSVTRTPRLPDSDRFTIGTGFSYQMSKSMSVDFAYNHLFFQNVNVTNADNAGHVLIGKFNTHADILSAGATFRFGTPTAVARPEPKTVYTK
jgi:long-chain fatty acid transport protein